MAPILDLLLQGKISPSDLISWLHGQNVSEIPDHLSPYRAEFVPVFLNFLRDQSKTVLQDSVVYGCSPAKSANVIRVTKYVSPGKTQTHNTPTHKHTHTNRVKTLHFPDSPIKDVTRVHSHVPEVTHLLRDSATSTPKTSHQGYHTPQRTTPGQRDTNRVRGRKGGEVRSEQRLSLGDFLTPEIKVKKKNSGGKGGSNNQLGVSQLNQSNQSCISPISDTNQSVTSPQSLNYSQSQIKRRNSGGKGSNQSNQSCLSPISEPNQSLTDPNQSLTSPSSLNQSQSLIKRRNSGGRGFNQSNQSCLSPISEPNQSLTDPNQSLTSPSSLNQSSPFLSKKRNSVRKGNQSNQSIQSCLSPISEPNQSLTDPNLSLTSHSSLTQSNLSLTQSNSSLNHSTQSLNQSNSSLTQSNLEKEGKKYSQLSGSAGEMHLTKPPVPTNSPFGGLSIAPLDLSDQEAFPVIGKTNEKIGRKTNPDRQQKRRINPTLVSSGKSGPPESAFGAQTWGNNQRSQSAWGNSSPQSWGNTQGSSSVWGSCRGVQSAVWGNAQGSQGVWGNTQSSHGSQDVFGNAQGSQGVWGSGAQSAFQSSPDGSFGSGFGDAKGLVAPSLEEERRLLREERLKRQVGSREDESEGPYPQENDQLLKMGSEENNENNQKTENDNLKTQDEITGNSKTQSENSKTQPRNHPNPKTPSKNLPKTQEDHPKSQNENPNSKTQAENLDSSKIMTEETPSEGNQIQKTPCKNLKLKNCDVLNHTLNLGRAKISKGMDQYEASPKLVLNGDVLNILAQVYSEILLFNFAPNIMVEFYFLMQLLTVKKGRKEGGEKEKEGRKERGEKEKEGRKEGEKEKEGRKEGEKGKKVGWEGRKEGEEGKKDVSEEREERKKKEGKKGLEEKEGKEGEKERKEEEEREQEGEEREKKGKEEEKEGSEEKIFNKNGQNEPKNTYKTPKKSIEFITNNVSLLSDIHNCVYFAVQVLLRSWDLVSLFERGTLQLLFEHPSLKLFSEELYNLLNIHLKLNSIQSVPRPPKSPIASVSFQSDTDNRHNFPSDQAFQVFRKQRDLFYEMLRVWEAKHLTPGWSFVQALGPKITQVLNMHKTPTNYAHFARLFQSQLLNMCTGDQASPPSQDEGDLNFLTALRVHQPGKYQRLFERLVTPSRLGGPCPSPTFPGAQEFFRAFLVTADHSTFNYHLRDILTAGIVTGSEQELGFVDDGEGNVSLECLGRDEARMTILRLRILSKFLGFLEFLPYQSSERLPEKVTASQVILRGHVRPPVNLCGALRKSASMGQLVVCVPWVVELLSMVDSVALHSRHYLTVVMCLIAIFKFLYVSKESDIQNVLQNDINVHQNCDGNNKNVSNVHQNNPNVPPNCNENDKNVPNIPQNNSNVSQNCDGNKYVPQNCDGNKNVPQKNSDVPQNNPNVPQNCNKNKNVPSVLQNVACSCSPGLTFNPSSAFFLKLVLGWFFDLPSVPDALFFADPNEAEIDQEEYSLTLASINSTYSHQCINCLRKIIWNQNPEPIDFLSKTPSKKQVSEYCISPLKTPSKMLCIGMLSSPQVTPIKPSEVHTIQEINICLDATDFIDHQMLTICCPFLSELKNLLNEFCMGGLSDGTSSRYRKITPLTTPAQPPSPTPPTRKNLQLQLEDNFFHNQPSSVRKSTDFIGERISSNIIKTVRTNILPEMKRQALVQIKQLVEEILESQAPSSSTASEIADKPDTLIDTVERTVEELGHKMAVDVRQKCSDITKEHCTSEHIKPALSVLLPPDVSEQGVEICRKVISRINVEKISSWAQTQLTPTLFIKELSVDADKIIRHAQKSSHHSTSAYNDSLVSNPDSTITSPVHQKAIRKIIGVVKEETLILCKEHNHNAPTPSYVLTNIKDMLRIITSTPYNEVGDIISSNDVISILSDINSCLNERQDITLPVIRALETLTMDLIVAVAVCLPTYMTPELQNLFISLWKPKKQDSKTNTHTNTETDKQTCLLTIPHKLDSILCARTLLLLAQNPNPKKQALSWKALEKLIILFLDKDFLTPTMLSDYCVQLLRHSWPQDILNGLSKLIDGVCKSGQTGYKDDPDLTQLLEWVAWMCSQMDDLDFI